MIKEALDLCFLSEDFWNLGEGNWKNSLWNVMETSVQSKAIKPLN